MKITTMENLNYVKMKAVPSGVYL
ncbi:hypothetical protein U0070_000059 [Myodes glareolus]|uniref:Uncharacterized protein n=1 Tax=Myodes glareolus TaxID=447135 RepID=A0AAW0I190_MYOGA